MYGQPLQPQPQRSSVADMFVAGDFTAAAQRLQPGKMFDFDMRGYLGSVRQQPLPGINLIALVVVVVVVVVIVVVVVR